ncbi:oligosaccharide flippase family protein [Faecalibaculum rodentium]|jgi:O-antigen/teichoic acid export membrane protein|uniref:oligosaccharide flippase family protein n=1 Tax=Faecalibaculum rodentium TaxID=1702221 RepID=UPI0025706B16|nr:oligosaccharide flippase family protein [Faecalibaculum rodentium]
MFDIIKQKISKLYSTGAFHITIGTFITKFVAFFGSVFVVRLLTKDDYGMLSYVENIYSYALIFAALGLSNALLRFLIIAKNEKERKSYFDYIIKNSVIRNVIIMLIMIIVSYLVRFPENYAKAKEWIPVVALLLPFQDLVNDDLFTLRAFFKNKLYAYASFIISTTLIVGRIVGAMLDGVGGVLWSRVIINFICGSLGYCYITKKLFIPEYKDKLNISEVKAVNMYSLQYMITNGFWALFMLNDTFLIGMLLNDPSALADYKVAYVLPGNISIFANAIGIFVAPYFTKNEKDTSWVRRNFRKVFISNALIVGGITLLVIILGEFLISFMYGEQYLNIVPLMQVLLVAAFINSGLRYSTANLLSSMGEVKYNMYVSAGGVILQIIADIIFIPQFGTYAVAIANCVIYLLMAIALYIIFNKRVLTNRG